MCINWRMFAKHTFYERLVVPKIYTGHLMCSSKKMDGPASFKKQNNRHQGSIVRPAS